MRHTAPRRPPPREGLSLKAGEAPPPQPPAQLTCSHCQRALESCAFCDEERCAVGVGGRYRRPATASARSASLAHHPVEVPAVGGCHLFVLADVLEGETRPRHEVSYGLRDEDLRRAGQDSCRGTPSKGEERGRTRLERVLAPGVRSGPCSPVSPAVTRTLSSRSSAESVGPGSSRQVKPVAA